MHVFLLKLKHSVSLRTITARQLQRLLSEQEVCDRRLPAPVTQGHGCHVERRMRDHRKPELSGDREDCAEYQAGQRATGRVPRSLPRRSKKNPRNTVSSPKPAPSTTAYSIHGRAAALPAR